MGKTSIKTKKIDEMSGYEAVPQISKLRILYFDQIDL